MVPPETSEPTGRDASNLEEKGSIGMAADLNHNPEAKIRNPLEGIPRTQLMHDVEVFAERRGLTEHVDILKKGALVAQSPTEAHLIDGDQKLSEEELQVLDMEVTHKWHMPFRLLLTVATCSIGAAVQGWDQTGSNGAVLFFPEFYGIKDTGTRGVLIEGLIMAGPYIGSAFFGCWLSDPMNNFLGRRGVIFVSAHFCIWPVIGSALCHTWAQQLACRLLMGIGMGIKASTVSIYAAENAPASIRGALVMSWQMWTAFGVMLGTAFNLAVYRVPEPTNWRLMLGAPFLPAVPLLCLIYFCPESPRWYIKKGRYIDAWKSLTKLRYNRIQVARDIFYISAQLEIEHEIVGNTNYLKRFAHLFTLPRVRRANLAAFTVMIAQQMCGINIIAFYSTSLFVNAGMSQFISIVGSFGFGMVNWLFAFPAFWTIDTFGRRSLLLFTFPQMFWTLLGAGLCTLIPVTDETKDLRIGLICMFVYLFAIFYSPGEGPVPFVYSSEVFPLSHREVGMSFAVATCQGWAAVLSISFPFLLNSLQAVGAFSLYAGFNVVAFIMIFLWVPETMQRTLEELDWVFAVPIRTFMKYQVGTVLPFWLQRWVFLGFIFDKHAVCPSLYQFEQSAGSVAQDSTMVKGSSAEHSEVA